MSEKSDLLLTHIRVPSDPVPVMAVVDGQRVQVGTGTLDKKTGVFTTTFFDTEPAQKLFKHLTDNNHPWMPVQYSEVEALPGLEMKSGG